jgi:tetrahydromethanopterin S-methyltransferase subunit A
MLDKESSIIVCEHYNEEGILNEVIRGNTAEDIVLTAIKRGLVSRLDHAAYLGSELAKAETALGLELSYIQDNPLSTNRC